MVFWDQMECRKAFAVCLCLITMSTGAAFASEQAVDFDIPEQRADGALILLGKQADVTVLFEYEMATQYDANRLRGEYTLPQAVDILLAHSGLRATFGKYGHLYISVDENQGDMGMTKNEEQLPGKYKPGKHKGLLGILAAVFSMGTVAQERADTDVTEDEQQSLEEIVVTGTRIRGGTTASPLVTIDAAQFREEGFADLGEVIRSIPQNFAGGQNPGVSGAQGIANQNITGGSSLNLRGIGPDATLTLLNGRRMAYNGFVQAVDVSAIPIEAVERIEIVSDGASAIYGSDAVAGVAAIILKRDFNGVSMGVDYGTASEGGATTRDYDVTAGTTWSGGGLIATFEDSSVDPIFARQRDYTNELPDPKTIYTGSDQRSGLLSLYQALGAAVELRVDALKTERERQDYFVSLPSYTDFRGESSVSLIAPSLNFSLPRDWTLSLGATDSKDEHIYDSDRLPIDGGESISRSRGCYCNVGRTYEIGAEGPLFALGGGNARLAIGAGSRTNDFVVESYTSDALYGGEETSRFAYAELNLPLIGPKSQTAGAQRLVFTAAVRGEDYDNFGRVTTPKFGLIYDPTGSFTLKATWGESFKAPTLLQLYSNRLAYLWDASALGGTGYPDDATVLMPFGGSRNLDAERATTHTVSLAFHPEALPGLEAELAYFDIDYTERVVLPLTERFAALSNPIYAEFINYSPTAEQQADIIATADEELINFSSGDYNPAAVVAIANNQYTNVAQQQIRGFDLSGSYSRDLGAGTLMLRGSVSWIESSQQNSAAAEGSFELAGTVFNPAKLKARAGAVWSRGGFTVSSFVNYIDGVTSDLIETPVDGASFTTVDANLLYTTGERDDLFSAMEFALSVSNLFNREPPGYAAPEIFIGQLQLYDSTNYSAIGRFVSLSISKHW